jgi:hydrogenase expression/formation protein HypC
MPDVCLSIPAKIVELDGATATVDVMGNRREADVSLVEEPRIGDYVLVHAGFAIEKMSAEDAAESLKIWQELADVDFGE